jgi:hypothetical protein
VTELPRFSPAALLRALVEGDVDFIVVGGIAAVAHGSVGFTQDLDIAYADARDNLDRLRAVLVELGARLRGVTDDVPFIPDGRMLKPTRVLTLETKLGPLDLLAQPDGAPVYERLRAGSVREDVAGVPVQIASLDDLIAMKRAAGRPRDLIAVEELEAIRRLQRERG